VRSNYLLYVNTPIDLIPSRAQPHGLMGVAPDAHSLGTDLLDDFLRWWPRWTASCAILKVFATSLRHAPT
jgi:hypothetical protein